MYLIALDSIAIRCLFYLLTVRTCILRSISILRRNEILLQININLQGLELCKYHIELFLCVVFFFSWTVIQPRECNTIILYSIVQQHLKLLLLHKHALTHPPACRHNGRASKRGSGNCHLILGRPGLIWPRWVIKKATISSLTDIISTSGRPSAISLPPRLIYVPLWTDRVNEGMFQEMHVPSIRTQFTRAQIK